MEDIFSPNQQFTRWCAALFNGSTQEYVTYLMPSKSTTTKTLERDFGEMLSPSPDASLGSARTETTILEAGFLSPSEFWKWFVLLLSNVLPGRGMALLYMTLLLHFLLLGRCEGGRLLSVELLTVLVMLSIVVAGTMPSLMLEDASNWKTSVHIPELRTGPVKINHLLITN
jgi:hypothetical protein